MLKQNSLTKISYLSFLEALLASAKFKIGTFSLSEPGFIGLLVPRFLVRIA